MRYETERIILEPFKKEYATDEYKRWFLDPEIIKFTSHRAFPKTEEEIKDFIKKAQYSRRMIVWSIFVKDKKSILFFWNKITNKHIGNVSLQEIDLLNRSAELAIIIGDKNYWGQGIGQEACKVAMNHAFAILNLNRLWLGTTENNHAMRNLALKIGMKQEGLLDQAFLCNGKYYKIYNFSILRKDYDSIIIKNQ